MMAFLRTPTLAAAAAAAADEGEAALPTKPFVVVGITVGGIEAAVVVDTTIVMRLLLPLLYRMVPLDSVVTRRHKSLKTNIS